jgi:ankyrin repeat protein
MSHRVSTKTNISWIVVAAAVGAQVSSMVGATSNDDPKNAPIHEAAKAGSVDKIRVLLAADPRLVNARNAFGVTPLYFAAGTNHIAAAKLLVETGADTNAKSTVGQAPLAAAAALGYAEVVRLLLAHGAKVNDTDKFRLTALHEAAGHGRTDVVKILLAHGADVAAKDVKGLTPLQLARQRGHPRVVEILVATSSRL